MKGIKVLEYLCNSLLYVSVLLPLFAFCKKGRRKYIAIFIILFILNMSAMVLGTVIPDNLSYNWMGKLFSIIVSILFIIVSRKYLSELSLENCNLSMASRRRAIKTTIISITALLAILIYVLIKFTKDSRSFDLETLLFQLTMPGLEEELTFRGIYLGLLNLAFVKKVKVLGGEFGLGLMITSVLFGLMHAMQISFSTGFAFSLFSFVLTGSIGFCLGVMAESTGSLVLPIVSHNLYNAIVNLAMMLK